MKSNYKYIEEKFFYILKKSKKNILLQELIDLLYNNFNYYDWIGIYILKNNFLILGPWNGKQATEHKRIPIGKGICGSAAKTGKTELIKDVKKDNRYLSCFCSTKSEIVIPIKKDNNIIGEIDIDSDKIDAFNKKDILLLEKIVRNTEFVKAVSKYNLSK